MPDTTVAENLGVFTRDQVEILSTRRGEPEWLRAKRMEAHESFATTPFPDTRSEDWRYTNIRDLLKLEELELAEESRPVAGVAELPAGLGALLDAAGESGARLVQVDASVVYHELPAELSGQGVIFTSLDRAVQ